MMTLTAQSLLTIWERGYARPNGWQALQLLSASQPDASLEELAALSIGRRDGRLLSLRERLFGSWLESVVDCPQCAERLQLTMQVSDIWVDAAGDAQEDGEITAEISGYQLRFRLPNTADLLALASGVTETDGQRQLLHHCLLEARQEGEPRTAEELPDDVVETIAVRMAAADPLADIRIDVICPVCKHESQVIFDIVSYLWQELNAWAIRTLREVHELAAAYSWRESDILSLSPWRRQLYLQMVDG